MDKRRANRIQGNSVGWSPKPVQAVHSQSRPNTNALRQSQSGAAFHFQPQQTAESLRRPPAEIVYEGDDSLEKKIISTTANGESIIHYYPGFLDPDTADKAFSSFLFEKWEQVEGIKHGQKFLMPREMIWYGPIPYSFSGATLKHHIHMPPIMSKINKEICEKLNLSTAFNSVLINRYRDNHDSVAWHSDDENLFGTKPIIASISLGEVRNFELRQKPIPPDNDFKYSQHIRIPLMHGSLLIMEGATQLDWQHQLKKEFHSRKERINLTFRQCIS